MIQRTFASLGEAEEWTESIYYALPALLSVSFADPPIVTRVDGHLAGHPFTWELIEWHASFEVTTQERQELAFASAWEHMSVLAVPGRRRLLAGLRYFHIACRLGRSGKIAGEFLAEVVLNLAKTLEVLFPPGGDGRSRDSVRAGLKALGYGETEIEHSFLPAMALRNEIDVGHVELGLFKREQLTAIHAYVERAEGDFRSMLGKLLTAIETGAFEISHHALGPPSKGALSVVSRLQAAMMEESRRNDAGSTTHPQ